MDWLLFELNANNDAQDENEKKYIFTNIQLTTVYNILYDQTDTLEQIEKKIINTLNSHISIRDNLYFVESYNLCNSQNLISKMELLQRSIDKKIDFDTFCIIMNGLSKTDFIIGKYYTKLVRENF